ncbi:SCO6745 family protein [Tsukamurella serpentis]
MSDAAIALARTAYETTEPFHVLAYFNPGIESAVQDLGLDPHTFYVGARAAPLGPAHSPVVAAAFYNFAPQLIDTLWPKAVEVGLAEIADRRYVMLSDQFRTVLAGIDPAEIEQLAQGYRRLTESLPMAGRTLASAWATSEVPDEPALALWRHIAVLREWRGDNHLAELIGHGLSGIEAGVLHEADLPDPSVNRRIMGRRFFQLTRGWTEQQWADAVARLTDRGLVEGEPESHRLTAEGMTVYLDLEAGTDATSALPFAADPDAAGELIERTRPLTEAVIAAGVLPGTQGT